MFASSPSIVIQNDSCNLKNENIKAQYDSSDLALVFSKSFADMHLHWYSANTSLVLCLRKERTWLRRWNSGSRFLYFVFRCFFVSFPFLSFPFFSFPFLPFLCSFLPPSLLSFFLPSFLPPLFSPSLSPSLSLLSSFLPSLLPSFLTSPLPSSLPPLFFPSLLLPPPLFLSSHFCLLTYLSSFAYSSSIPNEESGPLSIRKHYLVTLTLRQTNLHAWELVQVMLKDFYQYTHCIHNPFQLQITQFTWKEEEMLLCKI